MVTPEPQSPTSGAATPAPAAPAPVVGPVLAEVVARLGERVIDVQHLGVEPDPAVSPAGWCTLGGCAIALGLGLMIAGRPEPPAPVDPTIEIDSEAPAPTRGGASGIGFLLLLLGVVPLTIGLRPRPVPRDRYMIGEGPGVHLPIALPGARDGLALVRALERQIVLGLVPGMTGQIDGGETPVLLADLLAQGRSSYALPAGARCEAELGGVRFEIQPVDRAALEPAKRSFDRLYAASNLGALALIGGVLLLGDIRAPGELDVEEVSASRERAVRYLTDTPPPPPPVLQPPVPRDRPQPAKAAAPKPSAPPPPTIDTLATEVADPTVARVPKGTRRGISNDFSYARTAGFLNDPAFNESVERNQAAAQEGLLGYDNEADRAMWGAVLAAKPIDRPFGGLELAETERGGGLHDDRPKPAKAPGKHITIDMDARPPPPTEEQRKLARRIVKIEFERPYVQGDGVTPEDAQVRVRKQSGDLSRCFKEAVGFTNRVGTIYLVIKVGMKGRVSDARLDFGGEQLGDIGPCLAKAVRRWTFDPPVDRKPFAIVVEGLFSTKDY